MFPKMADAKIFSLELPSLLSLSKCLFEYKDNNFSKHDQCFKSYLFAITFVAYKSLTLIPISVTK